MSFKFGVFPLTHSSAEFSTLIWLDSNNSGRAPYGIRSSTSSLIFCSQCPSHKSDLLPDHTALVIKYICFLKVINGDIIFILFMFCCVHQK